MAPPPLVRWRASSWLMLRTVPYCTDSYDADGAVEYGAEPTVLPAGGGLSTDEQPAARTSADAAAVSVVNLRVMGELLVA